MRTIVCILLLAGLLVACGEKQPMQLPEGDEPVVQQPSEPSQPAPQQPQLPPPAEGGIRPVQSGSGIFGEVNHSTALDINSVQCDREARSITFRFKNDDNRSWQMNGQVAWGGPRDLVPVHVLINSYEVNGRNQYINNGETWFGPNWPFSKNCGDVEVLAPGEDVTCTVYPVPLKAPTAVAAGNNEIFINTPTSKQILRFLCE
jgi:predicted small lipoprotein YifL